MQEAQQAHLRILGQESMKVWSNIPGVTLPSEACSIMFPTFIEEDFPVRLSPCSICLQARAHYVLQAVPKCCSGTVVVYVLRQSGVKVSGVLGLRTRSLVDMLRHHVCPHAAAARVAEQASAGRRLGPHVWCWSAADHPSHAQSAHMLGQSVPQPAMQSICWHH